MMSACLSVVNQLRVVSPTNSQSISQAVKVNQSFSYLFSQSII